MGISFVIPCYNEEKYIRNCIRSIVREASCLPHYEIIVVDNNCTDQTVLIAMQEGVTVVSERQKGVVFARQKGYETAQYNLIANIDADWLDKNNIVYEHNKKIDKFYPDFIIGKVIIEIDGEHSHNKEKDNSRDAILSSLGYSVYRISAKERIEERLNELLGVG